MADSSFAQVFDTPGQALSSALQYVAARAVDQVESPASWTVALSTWHGCWAILLQISLGGSTDSEYFVSLNQEPGVLADPRAALAEPGVQLEGFEQFTVDLTTWPAFVSWFTDIYLVVKREILTACFDCVASVVATPQKSAMGGLIPTITSVMQVELRATYIFTHDALRGRAPDFGEDFLPNVNPPDVIPESAGATPVSLGPVVEALQEIAQQDATFSINQGAAAWSVRSSVVVGP